MSSNLKRAASLVLLASAANITFAAPAPVADLSSDTSATSQTSNQVSTPETDVQRLERLLRNRATVQLQMQQQIDEMTAELDELRGLVERNSYDMKQMLDRQRELFIEMDKLRNEVKTSATAETDTSDTGSEGNSGTYSSDLDEEAAYKNAVDLILKKKDYAGAINAFIKFQSDFPQSNFTPNSHYWLGQLYFARKQDAEAEKSFSAVVSFKDSNKRADSLVKLGDIATRNKQTAKANSYYQQVIKEHPNSASAKAAQKKLK
ncbi:tol-pal system protein YbgF [Vibrio sp. SCSIO 43137]|uniref:tol-pal system protein YbgF n=1 Tax=Vibrio sp. SCSIO 43137 TaxID=3021011 RepID=UPI00230821DC|nr:tol-pal system protein YbgF [Vibrio sp. SCSIO 43137]WCE30728.1 tol-pal system protein YbgF [Vibrio sp. SCSIO 43137]